MDQSPVDTWLKSALAGVSPTGERIRRTAGTESKALAQEFHEALKAELWRIAKLGERRRHTWNEAVVRWLKEQAHKATIDDDKTKLRWLDQFLRDKPLDTITRAVVDRITEARQAEGLSNATLNRMLEVLRAILRKCENDWEWLDKAPKVRMLKEPTRRVRFLTRSEADRLLRELPEHMADIAAFSLATGLRASNVTGLQWSQVDLSRRIAWVHPDQAKARRAIAVPLNAEAIAMIEKNQGHHIIPHVFSFRGKPIVQLSTKAWYAALKRAEFEDFRWHDLRHTWASWHVQNGTPRLARDGRLGERRNGEAIRAPGGGSPGTLCRSARNATRHFSGCGTRHKSGTAGKRKRA